MSKHLYLVILLTFVTGFASGLYVYFLTRDTDSSPRTPDRGYEITVTEYGGCESLGCPSLRMTDDGTYTYLVSDRDGGYERYEDDLSSRQLSELDELMETTPFTELENTVFTGTCPITYDGLAYRFSIRDEAEVYEFDTCVNDLDGEPLFEELIQYFDIMSSTY